MDVLVGCEYSGIVRDAFLDAGHYALSCDILPTESDKGDHWHGDIFECLRNTDDWDLIIMHPPCTHLCVSGNRWYGRGQEHHTKRLGALKWTRKLWEAATQQSLHVAFENPVGVLNDDLGKPRQYIQPWQYGHPEFKKTGLWMTPGLPDLQPTEILTPPEPGTPDYYEWQRVWRMCPGPNRGKERSRFFTGIAKAMAGQWS
ncbi:MAG: DNA cytosine methyltransferase [Lysobacterales bacterium]|nr:MAG: DNA cytosine methyltransferase [Xanthomonadales bacterium]